MIDFSLNSKLEQFSNHECFKIRTKPITYQLALVSEFQTIVNQSNYLIALDTQLKTTPSQIII